MSGPITCLIEYVGEEQQAHFLTLPPILQELFSESISNQEELDRIVDLYEDRVYLESPSFSSLKQPR